MNWNLNTEHYKSISGCWTWKHLRKMPVWPSRPSLMCGRSFIIIIHWNIFSIFSKTYKSKSSFWRAVHNSVPSSCQSWEHLGQNFWHWLIFEVEPDAAPRVSLLLCGWSRKTSKPHLVRTMGPKFFLGWLSTSLYLEWHNSYTYLTCLSDSFSTRAIKAPVNCQQWPASLSQLTLGHLRVRSLQVVPRYLYKCPLDILITAPSRPLHRRPRPHHPPHSNQRRPKKSTSRSKWDSWWFGRRHFFTSQQWLIRPQ